MSAVVAAAYSGGALVAWCVGAYWIGAGYDRYIQRAAERVQTHDFVTDGLRRNAVGLMAKYRGQIWRAVLIVAVVGLFWPLAAPVAVLFLRGLRNRDQRVERQRRSRELDAQAEQLKEEGLLR